MLRFAARIDRTAAYGGRRQRLHGRNAAANRGTFSRSAPDPQRREPRVRTRQQRRDPLCPRAGCDPFFPAQPGCLDLPRYRRTPARGRRRPFGHPEPRPPRRLGRTHGRSVQTLPVRRRCGDTGRRAAARGTDLPARSALHQRRRMAPAAADDRGGRRIRSAIPPLRRR